ncbi:MAG: BREX-1 system phosphatase PglZ type A [Bacteroidales bacterium]|nr:BREX-1 system phosphatase PglZ type A [Bacteroidales bacterium]
MNKIEEALSKLFAKHRIILWYDEGSELKEEFDALALEGIEKVVVDKNEFYVKYLTNKQKPNQQFLLYIPAKKPVHSENWLLDMELAHYVFQTKQEAMFAQELELDYDFTALIAEHIEFFKNKDRRALLKDLLGKEDDFQAIRYKMLAVLFNTDNVSLISFLQVHASAYNDGNERYDRELERYNLKTFYWKEISRKYGYTNEKPTVYDFLIEVFNNNFSISKRTGIAKESKILISMWKDSISYKDAYRSLSQKIAGDLKIESVLNDASIDDVIDDDLFELIDKKIISELAQLICEEGISADRLSQLTKKRENKYWYLDYEDFYACLDMGMQMISLIRKIDKTEIGSFEDGINAYAGKQYQIDYHYRKYIYHYRRAKQNKVLQPLTEKVEKVYCNDWLLDYGNRWQKIIDGTDKWYNQYKVAQGRFFADHVQPFVSKGQRLFVIISDAFRYECGKECLQKIQAEKRFEGELEHMVSTLPSYTQLGMAALLPNKAMSFQPESEYVLIDGNSTQGVQARSKILEQNAGVRAAAINAEDFVKMNSATDGREFVKQYDLIYIYHNRIDKVGDDKTSEEKVFEAVEQEIEFLMDVLKKIAAMNGNNMFITADHGFLYQNKELADSDFSIGEISGDIWKESRRYVIGKNLKGDASTKHFTAEQLNLSGDAEVLIPKSINRIRIKGAGARYVHGGATLQEIVIPLLKVAKKRQDTTKQVDVDIIKSTDKITTNILAVSFLQTELVSDKVLPRHIRSALYADDGEMLSDQFTYLFDVMEGTERMREVKHRFHLSSKASGKYKNQRIKLVLEEPVEGTSKWKQYKEYTYTLNISFTNDFDDM